MRLHSSSSSVTALLAVPTTACLLATGRCRAQGVSGSCTLAGAIFAQDKYLGAYCTNDKKEIHGYDWTWYVCPFCPSPARKGSKGENDSPSNQCCWAWLG